MQLKTYQQDTLSVLRRFLEQCRLTGVENAYLKITNQPEIKDRLGLHKSLSYQTWTGLENTPRVCLKVPTGGGKTILAAHTLKIVSEMWCGKEFPLVLWFCPGDTIRRQTVEALKNHSHPYRQTLNQQFDGKVRVFDIDDKFNITPQDIEQNVCIIVTTIQAFRQSKTDKYKVYAHSEYLEPHFARIPAKAGMELLDNGRIKFSFANLLYHHRPIEIVDEAHNAVSDLTQEVHQRLNPAAVIELTATPKTDNNTLYLVRPSELKDEEMIKLPIALTENIGWEQAVDQAVAKRAELETEAEKEREYLRPLLLLQAQDKNGEVPVAKLKEYLLNTIPENQIAVVTGDQKELNGITVTDRDCPIRFVITVEALKEGWDCPFAYVLCSLANIQSDTAVLQLLGRVMRMPYAARRKQAALNKAYAFVLSKEFGKSAQTLVERLKDKGFDETEAAAVIVPALPMTFYGGNPERFELENPLAEDIVESIPSGIFYDTKNNVLTFTPQTTEAGIETLAEKLPDKERFEFKRQYAAYRRREEEPSPAKRGEKFSVPKLLVELQGHFVFADADEVFESFDWKLADYAPPELKENEFSITPQGSGFVIDLDSNRLCYSASGQGEVTPLFEVEGWTAANLISWLDGKLGAIDIPQGAFIEWLRQMVAYLTETRGIDLPKLMLTKYVLAGKFKSKIDEARKAAKNVSYQQAFFVPESRVMLDFNNGFEFKEGMYDSEMFYTGHYRFVKHFLGSAKVPAFDGKIDGEEFLCAKAIDSLNEVKYWIRNVARHPSSFYLPTSTDRFYPDFAAQLNDGRILIAEYKGKDRVNNDDTKEKKLMGELWEKQSKGKGLFMIAEQSKTGLNVREQIKTKIGK
ncbi:MAG: DEAD/DEAH box helicase family protein [Planctomycetaceae bacterium]|jgi:type III restriction enzyme|nr:DEAD/DEAH box helicase family protein [Planctomycetaceae bacterium]